MWPLLLRVFNYHYKLGFAAWFLPLVNLRGARESVYLALNLSELDLPSN